MGEKRDTNGYEISKDDSNNLAVEVLRESFSSYDEDENESGLEEGQYDSEQDYEQLQNSVREKDNEDTAKEEGEDKDIEQTINFKE